MTLNKLRREVRRLDQRARRARTRLNKFRLKLAFEGLDSSVSVATWPTKYRQQYWYYVRSDIAAEYRVHDARQAVQVKKLVKGA